MEHREETIKRMLRVLDQFSNKFNIAICLPLLLEHEKFKNSFKHHYLEEYTKLHALCINEYYDDKKEVADRCFSQDATCQELMSVIIYDKYLNSKFQWTNVLESLSKYENEILKVLNEDEDFVDYKNIIDIVKLLRQVAEYEIRLTPRRLSERKLELRNAEALMIEALEDTENLEINFADETANYEGTVEKTQHEIMELEITINDMKEKHGERYESKISGYKSKLADLLHDVKEEEYNIENQLQAHKKLLVELEKINLEQEKLLRAQCIKTEEKCIVARKSYDHDLSKLNELKDTLGLQLQLLVRHCEVLKNEYDVQDVLYLTLKKERELAMMQAFAEQLDNFEKNRAARIIQRTWRAHHERMASKKKKKSRKNK